jgi:hypothetical protein
MTAMSIAELEVLEGAAEFFAPTSFDVVDQLIGEYRQQLRHIDEIVGIAEGELGNAMHYFIEGNCSSDRFSRFSVPALFDRAGAVFALNAAY